VLLGGLEGRRNTTKIFIKIPFSRGQWVVMGVF